jgi:hypothetical protein
LGTDIPSPRKLGSGISAHKSNSRLETLEGIKSTANLIKVKDDEEENDFILMAQIPVFKTEIS